MSSVALAWILRKGEILILSSGWAARRTLTATWRPRVHLDDADMAALEAAFPIGCAAGLRYPETAMAALGREAPPRKAALG